MALPATPALTFTTMARIDLAPYRLEAARNLGISLSFRRRYGRDFTGSVADYAKLEQPEQLDLARELGLLLQRKPPEGGLTPEQSVMVDRLAAPPPVLPSATSALFEGAVEGLQAIPRNIGGAVAAATGGSISSLLTKLVVGAGLVVGGYLLISSGVLRRRRR